MLSPPASARRRRLMVNSTSRDGQFDQPGHFSNMSWVQETSEADASGTLRPGMSTAGAAIDRIALEIGKRAIAQSRPVGGATLRGALGRLRVLPANGAHKPDSAARGARDILAGCWASRLSADRCGSRCACAPDLSQRRHDAGGLRFPALT
jgi:hypothetical protein